MENRADFPATVDRTLKLLWRAHLDEPESRRGPKQRVSVDEVVQAAIAVADAEGLAVFSVRKVAERLGLGAMSVYTYVPGKSELIGLMIDEVVGETAPSPHEGSFRERAVLIARQIWDEAHRHPWLLQAETARPWIGPHSMARYEWQLAAIEGVGFTDLEMDQLVTLLAGTAESSARASIGSQTASVDSGMTDVEWWEISSPVLDRLISPDDYPISSRVGTAAGEEYNAVRDPEGAFRFALDRILDGVELLLERRRPQ